MREITQTKVVVRNSKDEMVVRGNCFAACVASMLDMEIAEVPNVEVFFDTSWDYRYLMNQWLEVRFGLKLEYTDDYNLFHDCDDWTENTNSERLRLANELYIASGPSPRGVSHACIYQAGKLIWDPHPTREGILSVEFAQKLIKIEQA